jgi:hypothetical protein
LKNEEIFILLKKLANIHEIYYKYTSDIGDEDILTFMKEQYNNFENSKITVGNIIRDFFGLLNVLQENPQLSFGEVISSNKKVVNSKNELDDVFSRFVSVEHE